MNVEEAKRYLDKGELPPLDPVPYNDCIVYDGGFVISFFPRREALKYRRGHNLWG